jgi:hypothetical protein
MPHGTVGTQTGYLSMILVRTTALGYIVSYYHAIRSNLNSVQYAALSTQTSESGGTKDGSNINDPKRAACVSFVIW